jgi:hypothetical protein
MYTKIMSRNTWLAVVGSLFVAVFAVQFSQISKLKKDVTALRAEVSAPPPSDVPSNSASSTPQSGSEETASLQTRVTQLERSIANFSKGSRVVPMENGPAQLSEEEIARLQQRLFDPSTPDGDRLRALRAVRRNNKLSDEAITQTLSLLQTSTNANFRRELLQQLEGVTNAALKQPLIAMLDTETSDNGMREQIVNALRRYADDPAIETKLWDLALNDPNTRVRDQAREALARAPATPERVEQLLTKAANPEASIDERLISFRALRLAKSHTPELVSELATVAQNTTDPIARAKLFKSFNGLTDQSLMVPLVNGLQDADPIVRQNAANALSEFSDPRVQQWLTHLIQNDADPTVKREAHTALERSQRLANRPPQQ